MEHLKQFIYPEDKNNADGKILSSGNEEKNINKVELWKITSSLLWFFLGIYLSYITENKN